MSTAKHIIGSLGEIGSEIMKETARVPGDMVGSALEGLGHPENKKTGEEDKANTVKNDNEQHLDIGTQSTNDAKKKHLARRALEEYVGYGRPKKTPSVWEQKEMEKEEEKKEIAELKKKKEREVLRPISTKRKQGNLYGLGTKIDIEKQRNVKAE